MPKVYGYADDVNCFIHNDAMSLQSVFNEYARLTNLSGLELNASKTEILSVRSTNVRRAVPHYDVNYCNQTHTISPVLEMKVNGLMFQQNLDRMKDANVENVAKKMDRHLRGW